MGDFWRRTNIVSLAYVFLVRCACIGVLLGLCFGHVACPHLTVAERNRVHLRELRLGISQQQVFDIMGQPWKTEAYTYKDTPYVVLHYLTQELVGPTPAEEDVTLVVLEHNILIGYGDYIRVLFMFLDNRL